MTLKTLKDLEYVMLGEERNWLGKLSSHNDLRAEAIKWYKYYDELGDEDKIDFIIEFFNLPDEDLK